MLAMSFQQGPVFDPILSRAQDPERGEVAGPMRSGEICKGGSPGSNEKMIREEYE